MRDHVTDLQTSKRLRKAGVAHGYHYAYDNEWSFSCKHAGTNGNTPIQAVAEAIIYQGENA